MFIQVWSNGLHKLTKMIENHVHIRPTDHFKQVGVRGKMTEMDSIMWMADAFRCAFTQPSPHRSVKFWNCLMAGLCPLNLLFTSFSLFVGCGSIFPKVLPNMSQASLSKFKL